MQRLEANKISIPLRGYDELQQTVSACGTGDKVKLEDVIFIVDEATQELITGTINQVGKATVLETPPEEPSDAEREEARKAPVMTVMSKDLDRDDGQRSRDAFVA